MPMELRGGRVARNAKLFATQRKCQHRGCHNWTMSMDATPYCARHAHVDRRRRVTNRKCRLRACQERAVSPSPYCEGHRCHGTVWYACVLQHAGRDWDHRCRTCLVMMRCSKIGCHGRRSSIFVSFCATHRCTGSIECGEPRVYETGPYAGLCESHKRAKVKRDAENK